MLGKNARVVAVCLLTLTSTAEQRPEVAQLVHPTHTKDTKDVKLLFESASSLPCESQGCVSAVNLRINNILYVRWIYGFGPEIQYIYTHNVHWISA